MSQRLREWIDDSSSEPFLSLESIREIAIKSGLGKQDFRIDAREVYLGLIQSGWLELPVTSSHIFALSSLPFLHRDPFDRMLLAQVLVEGMTLLSVDAMLERYSVPVLGR